jgi:hypothetical protein
MQVNPAIAILMFGLTFCVLAAFFIYLRLVWQSFLRNFGERQEEQANQLVEMMIQYLARSDKERGQASSLMPFSTAQMLEERLTEERTRNPDASSFLRLEKCIHDLERDRRP